VDNYEGVVLSLGSNIGDREENLRNALVELELVGEINLISSLYESDPLLVTEQRSFYNIVIEITYTKSATHLLKDVKRIEEKIGRTKTYRYGPRVIDIDIIFFKGRGSFLRKFNYSAL
jgi:2-amino-4-hydroxy-6-hydroxymethyldihydropteridine diphosphokinase